MNVPPPKRTFGFNIIGYVSNNLGLGVNARNLVHLLLDKGLPVAILDLDIGMDKGKNDLTYEKYFVKTPDELPYGINLFIIGSNMIPEITAQMQRIFFRKDCINILCPMWELTVIPNAWVKVARLYDGIIAESEFIRDIFKSHMLESSVISATPPVYLPERIESSLARFGLPKDKIIFFSGFDPYSDPVRKNPLAVINAFQEAFVNFSNVCLVIFINRTDTTEAVFPDFIKSIYDKIEECCAKDNRIYRIIGTMSYVDRLSLYASCDVLVSLHRTEGLGLVPMEAMRLGKPVIATAWSGNMTYMKNTNSCLVGYKLIPVDSEHPTYCRKVIGNNAVWAEPDISEAAAWMRKLVEDPNLRESIGKRAAIDMANFQKKAEEGQFIYEIHAIWENKHFLSKKQE